MLKRGVFLFSLILILCSVTVARAEQSLDQQYIFALFALDNDIQDLFASTFLQQVPASQIIEVVKQYQAQLGDLKAVEGNGGEYTMVFEKGTAPARIVLNQNKKITGLWFGLWTLTDDDVSAILTELVNIEGSVSACVIKDNQQLVLECNKETPLAVGSSFKLAVLKAAYQSVNSAEHSWDTVITINNQNKSLPSGILQDWAVETPLTLKTLTSLMISISDNTATDHLIAYLGREEVEKYLPERNRPLLKTSEAFRIKYGMADAKQQEYISADESGKRALLNEINEIDLAKINFVSSPVLIDKIEWFMTTSELCQLIYELRAADELRINPGLANKNEWYLAGYKGGSESGVLQYTHLLQKSQDSPIYAVAITVNRKDQEVASEKINELTGRIISLIKEGKI